MSPEDDLCEDFFIVKKIVTYWNMTYPMAKCAFPVCEPARTRPAPLNPPSSVHRLTHLRSPTSHIYTSASDVNNARCVLGPTVSSPNAFEDDEPSNHHIPAILPPPNEQLTVPMTCPAPDLQSTRCTRAPLPAATARILPEGEKLVECMNSTPLPRAFRDRFVPRLIEV